MESIPIEAKKESPSLLSRPNESNGSGNGRVSYRTNNNRAADDNRRFNGLYQHQQRQERHSNRDRTIRTDYDHTKSIYVSELKSPVNREELYTFFKQLGDVKHFEAVPGRGIAFVEFHTIEQQKSVLAKTDLAFSGAPFKMEQRRPPVGRGWMNWTRRGAICPIKTVGAK